MIPSNPFFYLRFGWTTGTMQLWHLGVLLSTLVASIGAVSTFSPARPPALPLAVKSPYLSTWLNAGSDGGNGGYLAGQWSVFWEYVLHCQILNLITKDYANQNDRNQINGWCGLIRVDGTAYTWMGLPNSNTVTQTAYEYTSTKSIFTMDVGGKVEMNITFMSPITPNDFKRQSLVFSYLNVEVSSLDGNNHDVQVYADISAGE